MHAHGPSLDGPSLDGGSEDDALDGAEEPLDGLWLDSLDGLLRLELGELLGLDGLLRLELGELLGLDGLLDPELSAHFSPAFKNSQCPSAESSG